MLSGFMDLEDLRKHSYHRQPEDVPSGSKEEDPFQEFNGESFD